MVAKRNYDYLQIVFLQGDEAKEALQILDQDGAKATIQRLLDRYGTGLLTNKSSAGEADVTVRDKRGYILSYNLKLGYIGLQKRVPRS